MRFKNACDQRKYHCEFSISKQQTMLAIIAYGALQNRILNSLVTFFNTRHLDSWRIRSASLLMYACSCNHIE